jgi:hypothetical protein
MLLAFVRTLALVCAASCACVVSAAAVPNATLRGVAYLEPLPASGLRPGAALRDAPGPDREPVGLVVYNRVEDLPKYRVESTGGGRGSRRDECVAGQARGGCVQAAFCGWECAPILLAVQSFCRVTTVGAEGQKHIKWRTCEKARKVRPDCCS